MANRDQIVEDIHAGKPIIICDHREKEGDFFVAAEYLTPETVNMMLSLGKGVLCVSMTGDVFDRYGLERPTNMDEVEQTHFGQVIDLSHSITTGVSVADRCATIRGLTNPHFSSEDFCAYEGHVRTLESHRGGLAVRAGHTEAAVVLCEFTGCQPVGTIIEILDKTGKIADRDYLDKLAEEYELQVVTVNELINKINSPRDSLLP